jgi:hypothetical protein
MAVADERIKKPQTFTETCTLQRAHGLDNRGDRPLHRARSLEARAGGRERHKTQQFSEGLKR